MNAPRVIIDYDDEKRCLLCRKHLNKPSHLTATEDDGVFELNIAIMHPSCGKLHEKRKKLKQDLFDVEWLIFMKFMD